jgi:ABC-type transport system involved in multi-copper enzyme maturation permease subunit
VSLQGIRTIAVLELRQRLRTSRWPVVIGIWFAIIGGVAGLTWWAVSSQPGNPATTLAGDRGTTLYDVVLFFVLGLGMLVVPSLTATSINGDREHGVLATMQTTLLTSADIVIGKLVAAWAISIAFLLAASPFLVWAWIAGGIEIGRVLLAVAVLAFVLAVICAMGLMFSTLTARTISSAVLTYLTVAALTFGTVIAFLISMPILATHQTVRVKVVPDSWLQQNEPANPESKSSTGPTAADCVYVNREQQVMHPERTWWLLALNPFVVVADAAPSRKPVTFLGFEPLQLISDGARTARMGVQAESLNECWPELAVASLELGPGEGGGDVAAQQAFQAQEELQRERLNRVHAVWPYGFVFLGVLGAASTWVAVRRLRTPIRRLPRGTRIA